MNNRVPIDIDQKLKEYHKQQLDIYGKNRRDLYNEYDRSTITTNLDSLNTMEALGSETGQGFLSSMWEDTKNNMSNLWNSINQEMDLLDIDAAEANVLDLQQDKEDLEHIQRYLNLVKSRDELLNKINNDPSVSQWSKDYTLKLKDQLDTLNSQIQDLDDYFKGEGRTHRVIAENMFDGARKNLLTDLCLPWEAIKRGWNQSGVTIDWYKHGTAAGLAGSAIEGVTNLFAKPAGVIGEIASGAYGELKDIYTKATSNDRGNATAIRDYIQNIAQDGDKSIDVMYLGDELSKIQNVDKDIEKKYEEVLRDINAGITNVQEEQDDLKRGKIFGISGLYNKDAITEDWKLGREEFQNGSIFGAFLHPFYATADIASSLDMMKYQLLAMGVDAAIRHIPEAFIKKIPGLGTALTVTDIAAGVGAALASRKEETALEAIQALGERTANLARNLGGNPQQILDQIRKLGKAAGVDVDSLDEGQLWKLGIVLDVYAGEEFETAKNYARQGVNKLINANNALGVMDWAESIPYMSYFGDVVKALKVPGRVVRDNLYIGEKTLGQRLGTNLYPPETKVMNFKYAEDMANRVDGIFDVTVNKAVKKFVDSNHAKAALYTKHIANFAKNLAKKLAFTGATESIEEGQQHLLQERFNRGEYDDYNRETSMFDINEFVMNNGLAATAVADYFGLGFWDANNGDLNLVKAMNIGFWSSLVQSKLFHAFGNITQPSSDNIRGLSRQLRSDNVAVRILADQLKALQDLTHIDMFYDRFMGGANHANLVESLSTLAKAIDKSAPITITDPNTGEQRTMAVQYAKNILSDEEFKNATGYTKDEYDRVTDTVKKEFIEDDIKLMTAVWTLFNDENINKEMKDRNIDKKSEKYRQYLRDGATAIMDFHKSSELLDQQKDKLDNIQNKHLQLLADLFDENLSVDDKRNIIQSNPHFADMIDTFNRSYRTYLKEHAKGPEASFAEWAKNITTGEDLYKIAGKKAIEKFGIDEDIEHTYRKKKRGSKHKEESRQPVAAARIMADRIVEQGKLREIYDLIHPNKEKLFKESIKTKELFRNNKFVNDWVAANKPHLKPWLGDLDEIWDDEDQTQRDEILKGAYEEYEKPISKKDFIERRIRIMHQYKKMQAVLDNMKWAENLAAALEQVRYMTGLDVDPSKIQGWVKHYQEQLENLKKQEQSIVGNDTNYKEVFGESVKFDDDEEYQKLYSDYALNQAIRAAQATVMAAYTTIQANPESLKTAVFGYGAENTLLDENASSYKKRLDEYNALSLAERDEYTDKTLYKDLKLMSKDAAWKLIDARINELLERKKIAHRQAELEQRRPVSSPIQQTEEAPVEQESKILRTTEDTSDTKSLAEQQLRKDFYHESGKKKKTEKELLEERRLLKQQEEASQEETPKEESNTPSASQEEEIKNKVIENNNDEEVPASETIPPVTDPEPIVGEGEEPVHLPEDVDTSNIDAVKDSVDAENEVLEFIGEEEEIDRIDIDPSDPDVINPEDPTYDPEDSLTAGLPQEDEATGILTVDGEVLSDEEERKVRQDFDDMNRAEDSPLTYDETTDMSEKPIDEIVGDVPVNLVWQTCFYKFNEETTPLKLTVNGKEITQFNGKPLRPGAELAKKLLSPTWLLSCSTYYVVTQADVAKNADPNDTDAFTVALIIEDKDASYATVFRSLGDVISINTKNKGRDGNPVQYHINRRDDLKNWLLVKNMDILKVVSYSGLDVVYPVRKADDTDATYDAKLAYYRQLVVKAYNKAVNDYAKELYAKELQLLLRDNPKAKARAEKEWDSISKERGESDEKYNERLAVWNADHVHFRNMARQYFSKPAKTIFTEERIDEELDKLKANRDAVINAYLDKNGDNYVFPDSPKIGSVTPAYVGQSNGKINNQKTNGGIPVFRTITDDDTSIDEIQEMLDKEQILIGVGKGERAKLSGAKSIVSFGHVLGEEERVFFKDGGLSGKLYWIVSSLMGKGNVPIMLGEEKFDSQHREADGGGLETVSTRSGANKIKLLIDKISGKLEVKNDKYKPSAAEVLLYMILGENVLPGFADIKSLVPLFINEDAGTLLETQPQSQDGLLNNLAAKQLYFGPSVHTETITLESGAKQTRRVVSDDMWMFNIGLKQTAQLKQICDSLGEGYVVAEDGSYRLMQFTKEQILQNEALRQYIVQAISEQMHWNTDAATFLESASVAIQSSQLGALIRHLITKDAESGRFDDMTPEEYLNSEVSIMGCPQLSFRIGDFYTMPDSGSAKNLASLKPRKGSILAWMIKAGHIKTDVGENVFKAPFVFANGIKTPKKDKPAEKVAKKTGLPIDTTLETSSTLDQIGSKILNDLGYKIEDRHENGHVRGGQSGWKIRFVLKNPKTGKPFTADEYNKNQSSFVECAQPVLEYLLNYFKNPDGSDKISITKRRVGGQGHYIYTDKSGLTREPFKFMTGGEPGESDFTIYIGSGRDVVQFINHLNEHQEIKDLLAESTNSTDFDITPLIHGRVEGRSIGFDGYILPEKLPEKVPPFTVLYLDDVVSIQTDSDGLYLIEDIKTGKYYGYSVVGGGYDVVKYVNKNIKSIRQQIAISLYGDYLSIPSEQISNTNPQSNFDENPFYDETKQQRFVSKLPVAIRESGIIFEKSRKAIKEKIEKLTDFLLSSGARNSKFLDRIDVKENDILAAILLEDRTVDDIMEYAGEIGELIDEENDDDLNRIDKQIHDEKVKSLIEKYNKEYKTNLSKDDIVEDNVLKYSSRQTQTDAVEIATFYKNKLTGKTHVRIDSVKSSEAHDKNVRKVAVPERNYFIKGVTGVYLSKKSGGKFNEEKARKWLADTLGIDPANVMVMNGIKSAVDDNEVFGVVDAAVNTITGELFGYIGLSRRGGVGSQYHEAWHYVNLLIHDEQTRIAIYKAYLNSHPWLKHKKPKYGEVEERLAEDFRKWVELEEDKSIKGSILRMFNNVIDTIFIFKNKRVYKEVFKQIRNGAYKGTPLSKQAIKEFHDAYHKKGGIYQIGYYVPSLTQEEDDTFDYIVDHQQLMDASAALAKHFISSQKLETERDLKRISGTLVSDIQSYLQNWIETSDDILEENKNLLRDVLKNPDRVKQSIAEYFEELGLTFKIRKLKDLDKAKRLIDENASSLEKVDSEVEHEAEEKEERPDNTWDVFDLSVSKKDNASIRTKLFMKLIPVLKRNIDDNGKITYSQKYDAFGNEEMWSYSHAWNQITDKLWLCESIDATDDHGKYLSTSMMGMVERLAKGNVFFAALLDKLTNIDSSKFQNTILKSQLYATVNSNKPQVSFLTLYDPEGRNSVDFDDYDTGLDSMEDNGVEIVSNTSIADRQREWKMSNDNTLEANKNTIREWSQSITGQGLIDISNNKNTVSSAFADILSNKILNVRSKIDEYNGNSLISDAQLNSEIRNTLIPLIIDLYDEIGISADEDVIQEFIKQTLEKPDPSVREQLQILSSQFAKTEIVNVKGKLKEKDLPQDSIPRVIDAIIAAGKSTNKEDYIKFNGDTRQHSLDKLFHGFANDEASSVYKFASSMNAVHPSARQFSVKDPSGNIIYPISSNSFVSDRIRVLSVDGKKFGARMSKSKYCGHSQLLSIAQNETDPVDTNSHFKLNAFVGIKDGNRNIGADYFGITPMEDYLAKLQMLERDQIVLPTMADKKTWYSISHRNLRLSHDAILFTPYKDVLNQIIYDEYAKEHSKPEEERELRDWQYDARRWYKNLDPKSDERIQIDNTAKDAYNDYSLGIGLRQYSDDTLTKLADYMQDELEAVIAYYDPKNVRRIVKNSNLRVENYHGKVENDRLDFSGNGGKFRYFYDAITFTDKNGKTYNLNQRLLMLFELQKKIENGDVKNIASDDPMFKYVGGIALGDKLKSELDGFELIRQELENIRKQYFKNGFPSKAIKSSINDIFMKRTIEELDKLSDPQSPVKLVKKENGSYIPEIIPVELLNKYVNSIYGKIDNKQVTDSYSDVTILSNGILTDALFSLIANYAVNSAISVIEFEKVFSGDPAFYSRKKAKDNPTSTINERVSLQDGSVADIQVEVDNVYDAFSDKIKRLGSTLSPGDEIRLYYSKEELEKKGRRILSIDRYTNMNVEDIEMRSTFMDIIEKSFKKLLLVDNIRNLDSDKFKQWCDDNGMSFEDGLQKIYDDDTHFEKVYGLFKDRQAAIEKELLTQIKPYTKITVSDAQVFIRPEMYRRIRIGLGQWSNNDELAYMILEGHKSEHKNGSWLSDPKIYNAVRLLQLYPLKMTYFQNDPTDDGGRKENSTFEYNKPILNKMAIFPWFRFMAGNGVGAELYKRMNKKGNELDMISFKSAVKVGAAQEAAKMKEDGATGEAQLSSIDDLFNKESSQYIDYDDNADNANYGKTKTNAAGSVPVEIQYLQNLRYLLNTEAHEAESRNIGTQMFKLAFSSIIDDAIYGADENGNGGKYGYLIKAEIMSTVKHLTNLGILNLHKRFFTDDPNTGYRIDMDAVHDFVISIARSNGLGYSAEQIARNGVAACLARREVFENSATAIVNSEVIDINTPGGTAVQQSSFGFSGYGKRNVTEQIGAFKINFNNGEMLKWHTDDNSMEVMLSINFFRHVLPESIKKKTFEELRQWLIDHDIIKGKNTNGEDSKPNPFGIGYRIPTQGLSSIFGFTVADVLPPQCGDLIVVPPEFTAQTGSDFDVDKLFLATKSYINGEYEEFSEDNPTKGGLTNKLLECYMSLLCDNKNYSESRASIDTFTKMLKDELIDADGVLRDPQDSYIPSCTELMPFFLMNRKLEFSVGKAGIAPFALNVTNLALTQYSHLTMRYEGVIKEYDFGSLDAIDGKDGRRISGWLSAMVNAHVDVAKDPYIFDLNVNHATYNYANFLIRAGKGMSTFTFLSQQSLKNIASDINNSGGLYGSNPFGDSPTEEINNISKNVAIKAEYKRLLDRLESLRKDYEHSDKKLLSTEEAVKLDHIIDYVDYILMPERGKGNTKKKYRDQHGSAPEFEFDRKLVFNKDYAIKQIKNKRSSKQSDLLSHLEFQVACVRAFEELSNHAQAISDLVSVSQIDTKKFGNTIRDHINFDNKIKHFMENSSIWTINQAGFDDQFRNEKGKIDHKKAGKEAVRRYFEESYLQHKFESATSNVKEILKTLLITATDEYDLAFKSVMCKLNGGTGLLYDREFSQDKIDAIGEALDNLFRFNIMFNIGKDMRYMNENAIDLTLGGNKQAVIQKMHDLLYGSDNIKPLYKRLDELKRALKSKNAITKYPDLVDENGEYHNDLLDALIPLSPTKNVEIGRINIKLQSRDTTTDQKSRLIASFAQLLDSANQEVSDFAKDLVFYAYYSNYDQDVRNSFFDLVPPAYREQYDWALNSALYHLAFSEGSIRKQYQDAMLGDIASVDSNAKTKAINVGEILDVICRNYWWNDNIVGRHYPGSTLTNFNNNNYRKYGPECMSQGEYGFPKYVCMQSDYKLKGNPFFKIKIKGKSVLYRKIGEIEKSYAVGDKAGQVLDDKISIYAPVPKAGYRAGDVQQYEFYANYETPSLFNDNKLGTTMSIESVRNGIEKLVNEYNDKPAGELVNNEDYENKRRYELNIKWETEEIPEVYDILNTDVYKKYDDSVEPKHGNVFIVPYSQGKNAWYTLNKKSNVILNLVISDDANDPKVPEGSEDKVVTINITKPLSKESIQAVKDLLSTGYKWVNVTSSGNMNAPITKSDIEEYLQSFGLLSEKDKAYYRKHADKLSREIKQFKAAKVVTELLKATEDTGIILHTLFDKYGDTYTSKVIQLAAANLKGIVKNANVHVDAVNYVGKLGMAKRLHHALDSFTESSFVEQDVEQLADDLAKVIAEQTSTKRAEKLINDTKSDKKDIDSNEPKSPQVESKIVSEVSEEKKEEAQNKECGIASSEKPTKKKSKFSISEDVDEFDTL